jgi:hypothetical protein
MAQPCPRCIDILLQTDETEPDAAQSAIINWTMGAQAAARIYIMRCICEFEFRFRQNVDLQRKCH